MNLFLGQPHGGNRIARLQAAIKGLPLTQGRWRPYGISSSSLARLRDGKGITPETADKLERALSTMGKEGFGGSPRGGAS